MATTTSRSARGKRAVPPRPRARMHVKKGDRVIVITG